MTNDECPMNDEARMTKVKERRRAAVMDRAKARMLRGVRVSLDAGRGCSAGVGAMVLGVASAAFDSGAAAMGDAVQVEMAELEGRCAEVERELDELRERAGEEDGAPDGKLVRLLRCLGGEIEREDMGRN